MQRIIKPKEVSSKPFSHYELPLDTEEKKVFKEIRIKKPADFSTYGQLESLTEQLKRWFENGTFSDSICIEIMSKAISKIIHHALIMLNAETGYIILRSGDRGHEMFDVPRWHIDGNYFDDEEKNNCQKKVVMALHGPGTLFYNADRRDRATLKKYENERMKLVGEFNDRSKFDSTPENHGSIFIANSEELGGVHSEPPIKGPRLFMSIVPGAREQIKNIKKSNEMNTTTESLFNNFLNRAQIVTPVDSIDNAAKCTVLVLEYLKPNP